MNEIIHKIEEKYGSLLMSDGSKFILGLQSFAELYRQQTRCIYLPNEKQFYQYSPASGLWQPQRQSEMISQVGLAVREFAGRRGIECGLARYQRPAAIRDILTYLEVQAEVESAFFSVSGNWVHCRNTMVELTDSGEWEMRPFSPDYHSRNRCDIVYDPAADCPRFKEQLLSPLMEEDDVELLQKYFGQCLLGRNLTQSILLLTGSGGSGKGTVANLLELLVGPLNSMQIRPGCIGSRFETSAFLGKTLLTGKESQTSFFTSHGMGILKSLVGDDTLRVELKHSNEQQMIQGTFNVFIVGNAIPLLEFESNDDLTAWHRRLRWIKCKSYMPPKPIDHFADTLFADEGAGILNWSLAGLRQLLLANSTRLPISKLQKERLNFLFGQSFQLESILRNYLEEAPGSNLTTEEIFCLYVGVANHIGWQLMPERKFQAALPNCMQTLFHLSRCRDIKRPDTDGRWTNRSGYRNIKIKKLTSPVRTV